MNAADRAPTSPSLPSFIPLTLVSLATIVATAGCTGGDVGVYEPIASAELQSAQLTEAAIRVGAGTQLPVVDETASSVTLQPGLDAPGIAAGNVLVSDGQLRRVVSIANDRDGLLTAVTEPAQLEEAFEELTLNAALEPDPNAGGASGLRFDLGTFPLFSLPNARGDIQNAAVEVIPDIHTQLDLATQRFHLDYALEVDASFELLLQARGNGAHGDSFPIPGANRDFVILAGWVPVVITIELIATWQVEYSGAVDLTMPVGLAGTVRGSLDHQPGIGWSAKLDEHDAWADGGIPTLQLGGAWGVGATVSLQPRVTVAPFRVAGPYVEITPSAYARGNGDEASWRAEVGARFAAEAGFVVDFFKILRRGGRIEYALFRLLDTTIWSTTFGNGSGDEPPTDTAPLAGPPVQASAPPVRRGAVSYRGQLNRLLE